MTPAAMWIQRIRACAISCGETGFMGGGLLERDLGPHAGHGSETERAVPTSSGRAVDDLGRARIPRANDDLRRALAELLVPALELVLAGRDAVDRERAVGGADREPGMIEDADPGFHPRMQRALERHHHFALRRLPLDVGAVRRLLRIRAV